MEKIVGLEHLRRLARLDRVRKLASFFVRARREAVAAARTPPRFSRTETNRATKVSGCRCGWTTWTRCTSIASPLGWRSHFRPPICRGTFARCTFAIPMGMCSGWDADSSPKSRTKQSMSAMGLARFNLRPYKHTTRFDLCVANVSFLSALVFSIKAHNE